MTFEHGRQQETPSQDENDVSSGQKNHGKKRLIFWLAVIGTFCLIVGVWALVLPMQLKTLWSRSAQDMPRWRVLNSDRGSSPTLEESLKNIQRTMEDLGKNVSAGTASSEKSDMKPEVDKLRAEIEAVRSTNAPAVNVPLNVNTNEKK